MKRKLLVLIITILAISNMPQFSLAEDNDNYIIVTCGGDVTIGYKNEQDGEDTMVKVIRDLGDDYSYIFAGMKDLFSEDDLTIVNLETTVTDYTQHKVKTYYFRAPYEYINVLKEGSIEAVNYANNHINDYLEQGRVDTIRSLYEEGIVAVGESNAGYYEVDGVTIGLLGYTDFQTRFDYESAMKRDIPYMKKMYDIVIVNFHWGNEKKYEANRGQKDLGRMAIDLGADLVVGHHPHVIGPIEYYNGKYIVYSMGNLAFSGNYHPFDFDIILFQQRFKINEDGSVVPYGGKVIPAQVSSNSSYNDYQPTIMQGEEAARILDKLRKISKILPYGLTEVTDDWMIDPPTRNSEK